MDGDSLIERGWAAVDASARTAKRVVFAETRRGFKVLRERIRNISAKQMRRLDASRARLRKQAHERDQHRKELATFEAERAIERDIAQLVSGSDPIVVGPWLSEVGFEVLYWVPFVRWVQSQYRIPPERLVVVTRGGAASWYSDITPNAVELFDLMSPEEFTSRNAERSAGDGGTIKQWSVSSM